MRVLLVDDDGLHVRQLRRYLSRHDHQVSTAGSGEAAIGKLETMAHNSTLPQVVITDLRMDGLSGIELIRKVNGRWPEIYTLVMTGYATVQNAVKAMRYGASDFITKPFRTAAVEEKLKALEEKIGRHIIQNEDGEQSQIAGIDPSQWLQCQDGNLPRMVISPRPAEQLEQFVDDASVEFYQLADNNLDNSIALGHIQTLKRKIDAFCAHRPQGAIYFEGIGALSSLHGWEAIEDFLLGTLESVKNSGVHLCLGVADEELDRQKNESLQQMLSQDQLVIINRSLAHESRLALLYYISKNRNTTFGRILKTLEFSSSAGLTFHLKQLLAAKLLFRDEKAGGYCLTEEGVTALEALSRLRQFSINDPSQSTTMYNIPISNGSHDL